ncbi:nucleolar protein 10 [Copidosoma floridanum]|uniref:nucleolar protein 10 n=1 Tax=Copidosoma floridanum TaxID=29053 RepID=UPI0006C9D02D|nr:nucleolar protein 10 [Copidosoma floridanum]
MQVSEVNDVKIYNLSAGKSLPEWLSERKRRNLAKKDVNIRRRIELIQDFDMPAVSTSVRVSKDGQYIFATGIYKPRLKCFDVNHLSLKFERCFDSEVVTFEVLSDDYSKIVFLQCDRYIEIHSAPGKYYRLRIPRFGRDLQYHYPSCDLFVVGTSNEIYRLNLERGQFLQPFISDSSAINKCTINPVHSLLFVGTNEGKVEAWDPRVKNKVGILDCGFSCIKHETNMNTVPSVTALKSQGALTLGVGTATGQVLLYDIRSNSPFTVKDHNKNLPIRNIEFHKSMDLVYSMDSENVKIWEKDTGKIYTFIEAAEAQSAFNDLCIVPNTGLMFIANESPKIQSYYIPSLGPAPKWCGFLDNLTEELEELDYDNLYDDYKFVTEKELEELDLAHLKGTNLLRAYMHGHFIDIRLYRKAKSVSQPFSYEEYRKKKIQEKIQEERPKRVQVRKLPAVNKELALKYIESEMDMDPKKKKNAPSNVMKDERFKALFENPDFQVDTKSQEYSLLHPVLSHLDQSRKRRVQEVEDQTNEAADDDEKSLGSDAEDYIDTSDDEKPWVKDVKKQYKLIKDTEREAADEERRKEAELEEEKALNFPKKQPKFYELKDDYTINRSNFIRKRAKMSLGDRVELEESHRSTVKGTKGNKEMTFKIPKKNFNRSKTINRQEMRHQLRPAGSIGRGKKSKY